MQDASPDMRSPIELSDDWTIRAGARAELLNHVADVPTWRGKVPLVMRFPGFEPATDLLRADPETDGPPLGETSHVDAILVLTGGCWSGLDLDPIFGRPTGSRMAKTLEKEPDTLALSSEDRAALEELETKRKEAEASADGEEFVLDLVVVRQMRATPVVWDGHTTNRFTAVEERRASLYRSYHPFTRPPRSHRINGLIRDAAVFARVQAYNLGFITSPRPEIIRRSV